MLVNQIDECAWLTDLKRRVQHYGYRYDYRARSVNTDDYLGELPIWASDICEALVSDKHFKSKPDQVIVNEYLLGQGIAPHVDCVPCFGDSIASLSLSSGCEMAFQNVATGEKFSRYLESNSSLILSGEARYKWRHGIVGRKSDVDGRRVPRQRRLSLTFRSMNLGP